MFALYTTVESTPGKLETTLHGTCARKEDAEQIGRSLQLLYAWVKHIDVRWEEPASLLARAGETPPCTRKSS